MLRFFIRRYLFALLLRRTWLLLALIPPLIYLGISAAIPDRFLIYQDISISQDTKIPAPKSPVDTMPISDVTSNPADFLLDKHAVNEISDMLSAGSFRSLIDRIEAEMSLGMSADNKIRITYFGTDRDAGKKLVAYYSKRLLKKADEGARRNRIHGPKKRIAQKETGSGDADLSGKMELREKRIFWRAERSGPAINILILSLILLLFLIGALEFIDPSLKSERQVARYLGLRSLGVLPDLHKLSRAIKKNP